MADFEPLPVTRGVGPYHFNRFRILFKRQPSLSKEMYAKDFVDRFPVYLNSPYATVVRDTEHQFDGDQPLYRFHGISEIKGVDIAMFHHDWVSVLPGGNPFVGFSVQTLERKFRLLEDAKMAGEGVVGGGLPGFVGGAIAGGIAGIWTGPGALATGIAGGVLGASTGASASYFANFKHFLAGRRSWRLDKASAFGLEGSDDDLVLETAAVERYSCLFYEANGKLQGLEDKIPDIWNSMLSNFVIKRGLTAGTQPIKEGWKYDGKNKAYFMQKNDFESLENVKSNREFQLAHRLHPTLLPG